MSFNTQGRGQISGRSPGSGGVSKKKASSPDSGNPDGQHNISGKASVVTIPATDSGAPAESKGSR